ncbi:MAG: hypothetical protein E6X34_08005 [Clostridium sp.]|uniref:hypothetical protein n=1 Tax=Clostridium sp. TaxID=1506 RepID=UPI002913063C|nr:hypothetical protein [Clostridium sp.]MDU4938388.1 hypothetical protein [Clostridium sp.]
MIFFKNKRLNEEIAASTELENNEEVINPDETEAVTNLCEDLELTKTATPDKDVCTNRKVHVTLTIKAKKKLNDISVTDTLSTFMESIVESNPTPTGNPQIGPIVVNNTNLTLMWHIGDLAKDATATLTYDAIIKPSTIGNAAAFVNQKIEVEDKEKNKCTKNHGDQGLNDGLNITCPIVLCNDLELTKTATPDQDVCNNRRVHVVLTIKALKKLNDISVTDTLSNFMESIVENNPTPTGNPQIGPIVVNNTNLTLMWHIGDLAQGATATLTYDAIIKPTTIGNPAAFVNQKIEVEDRDRNKCTKTHGDEGLDDDLNITCPQGQCCCQACEPITVEPCELSKTVTVDVDRIKCTGKLVDVIVNLQHVCGGKTLNVGVFLVENVPGDADGDGNVEPGETIPESRGFIVQEVTITGNANACVSQLVSGFCFPLTDDTGCDAEDRSFTAKVFAVYTSIAIPNCDCDTATEPEV